MPQPGEPDQNTTPVRPHQGGEPDPNTTPVLLPSERRAEQARQVPQARFATPRTPPTAPLRQPHQAPAKGQAPGQTSGQPAETARPRPQPGEPLADEELPGSDAEGSDAVGSDAVGSGVGALNAVGPAEPETVALSESGPSEPAPAGAASPAAARGGASTWRNLTGALAAGMVLLALGLIAMQVYAGNNGQPGPGLWDVGAHVVAAVVAVVGQRVADRRRGLPAALGALVVLAASGAALWFFWWA